LKSFLKYSTSFKYFDYLEVLMTNHIETSDSKFNADVLEKSRELPVVVDFWAPWCMPCRMLGPVIEKVARKYSGKAVLAKLNVDENPETSQKYGIMSIPSVKLFVDGEVVDEFMGLMPEKAIAEWLDKNLKE